MEESGSGDDGLVKALMGETERVKDLYTQCSEQGIAIEDAWPAVRSTKELIAGRRFLLALDRLRELKIELLAELLLWEQLPPENFAYLSFESEDTGAEFILGAGSQVGGLTGHDPNVPGNSVRGAGSGPRSRTG